MGIKRGRADQFSRRLISPGSLGLQCVFSTSVICSSLNKASEGDRTPAELFKFLKDAAAKVLHSICHRIWKTSAVATGLAKVVFIPISKKGNAKKCLNYRTIVLISHASKVTIRILKLSFSSM